MSNPPPLAIAVGDRLLVVDSHWRGRETVEVEVTKAPRIWLEMAEVTPREGSKPRTWRLRRDTQDDGRPGHGRPHFLTPDEHARNLRIAAVNAYLAEAGIRTQSDKPWHDAEHRIVLANLLRAHEGLPAL